MTPLHDLRQALATPLSHPDPAELGQQFGQVTRWVLNHFATLPGQSIGRSGSRAELESLLREPPPEEGQKLDHVLAQFEERVAAYAFRTNHPCFFAFVPGAPNYLSVFGDWLCSGTNFFAGVWLEAAGPAEVELVVLDWFKEFLGYPREAQGLLTSGGSEANLTALVAAREPLSYADRQRATLYVTEQRHWSVDRAAKVMGLRSDQVCPIATTDRFRLDPAALAARIRKDRAAGLLPWAVVANAGATNTGAVDPLAHLADVCGEQRLWLHVDAAYGWSAILTAEGRTLLDGIARADSITLDPHKWFGQTFEAGCLLVRDGRRLDETFCVHPEYMQDVAPGADEVNFCDRGIALTRRFRALKIWFSVKVLGVAWFRRLVERCCLLAEFAQAVLESQPSFEILCPRQLSIVCYRYVPAGFSTVGPAATQELNRLNLLLVDQLRATGKAFISSTRLGDNVALRFCFVNWRTTAADVEETVRLLASLGQQLVDSE
jgi:aromatic-L-amino-acid decarboxylase